MVAGSIRVYKGEGTRTYSVADDGGWYPGIYEDEEAARLAPTVDIGVLERRTHWSVRGKGDDYQPVTLAEVQQWAADVTCHNGVIERPKEGFNAQVSQA